jgi:GNAT superfamily N-acetyltransferase
LNLRDLRRHFDRDLVDRFYREVLAKSFFRDELESAEYLAAGLQADEEPRVLASIALGSGDEVLGGVVAECYTESGVLLIAYVAVRPNVRRRGIGAQLMRRAATEWYADEHVLLAVCEVHDPRHWSEADGEDSFARLRFFERLGAQLLAIPFLQPAIENGGERVRGFLLIALHVDERIVVERDGRRGIAADRMARFVRQYYEAAEGAREPYDPELARLLARIERDDIVALLPLGKYAAVPEGPAAELYRQAMEH